ncbi:hypothetical protein GFD25_06410 [Bifidobacterium aerophilum]|uniref:Substrate-binding domain-containing protein n=2 Tax=Bifidobacterium aerophilum TaxID=1798155 RepID=A0A6N9Z4T0_9BIFI|nr:hypothetical protein [Bifidobacterium aerophilum]
MAVMTICAAMTLGLTACASSDGSKDDKTSDGTDASDRAAGSVAIFTPSDGVTISGNTPLNKWTKFVPALTDALIDAGFKKSNVTSSSAGDLDKQSRDIQDYVVERISSSSNTNGDGSDANANDAVTLVVAPIADADDTVRQYGDYVSQSVTADDDATDTGSGTSSSRDAVSRLTSALNLARENGMHVVMLSDTVEGVQPDLYVRMSTAEQIGRIQAQKLVSKLDLDKVSADNPKNIEVLLPYTAESGSASDGVLGLPSNGARNASQEPTSDSSAFAEAAFKGVWSVLRPYFASGKAISASGTLDANTGDDDWRDVSFACAKESDAREALRERLGMKSGDDAHTRIDGVIAMNDFTASAVVKELADLGYTGSAADINPSITISGIVENITGRKDLQRGKVPDPIKAPESSQPDDADADDTADSHADAKDVNSKWPIVTGYGAYVDVMPQIVAGQQWMTALEDRDSIAKDTAKACRILNAGDKPTTDVLRSLTSSKVNGKDTATIARQLIAVSAYNLKDTLIDPGYISLADAGL